MIPKERVLEKLDSLLRANDYPAAKRLLKYWLSEAEYERDFHGVLLMQNELMGLCRKLGEKEEALSFAQNALDQVKKMDIENDVGAATTYLNSATVLKAFGRSEEHFPCFKKQRTFMKEAFLPLTTAWQDFITTWPWLWWI